MQGMASKARVTAIQVFNGVVLQRGLRLILRGSIAMAASLWWLASPGLCLAAQQWTFEIDQLRPDPNIAGLIMRGPVAIQGGVAAVAITPTSLLMGARPFIVYLRDGDGWHVEDRVTSPLPAGGSFPNDLAFGNDVLFVAAGEHGPKGVVFALDRAPDGSWGRTLQQIDPPAEVETFFGVKIAAHGEVVAIAAYDIIGATPGEGRVYLYRRIAGSWTLEATLVPPPGSVQTHSFQFGGSLSVHDDRIAVAARNHLVSGGTPIANAGIVFVYERDMGGAWNLAATLTEPNPGAGDALGAGLAIEGDLLVAGRPKVSPFSPGIGEAIVYERSTAGVWQKVKTLHSTGQYVNTNGGDNLGQGNAIDNGVIAVSAPGGRDAFGGTSGAIFVYRRDASGSWPDLESGKFGISDGVGGQLGQTIGFSGGLLVASDIGRLFPDQAAFVFALGQQGDFCPDVPVSGGATCRLDVIGSPLAGSGTHSLVVSGASPGTRYALFGGLSGNAAGCIPVFGIGSLCICAPVVRVGAGQISAAGGADYTDLPEMSPLARRMFDLAGTAYFQAVFADYSLPSVEIGLSNAIAFETRF